mmetsp:Transcript_35122/g.79350  ORF Transcript_35122/g.79350 Transcript_35122/m.79350 type:complete len:204 (-) Transcript_35122:2-613(-)
MHALAVREVPVELCTIVLCESAKQHSRCIAWLAELAEQQARVGRIVAYERTNLPRDILNGLLLRCFSDDHGAPPMWPAGRDSPLELCNRRADSMPSMLAPGLPVLGWCAGPDVVTEIMQVRQALAVVEGQAVRLELEDTMSSAQESNVVCGRASSQTKLANVIASFEKPQEGDDLPNVLTSLEATIASFEEPRSIFSASLQWQ